MEKVQVIDQSGKLAAEISLPQEVFSYPVKSHLLYESASNFLANQRRGTAATKTRGDVSGGGRKPWRQKGTGRARAGSNRSPLWKKGGTTHGPQPRSYSYSLPRNAKQRALKSALVMKHSEKAMLIVDELALKEPKAKLALKLLQGLKLDSALLVDSSENKNLFLAVQNIPKVKAVDERRLNVFDILSHKWLVFSQKAFESLMERWK
jgi:large subunit ribosomal protein L4